MLLVLVNEKPYFTGCHIPGRIQSIGYIHVRIGKYLNQLSHDWKRALTQNSFPLYFLLAKSFMQFLPAPVQVSSVVWHHFFSLLMPRQTLPRPAHSCPASALPSRSSEGFPSAVVRQEAPALCWVTHPVEERHPCPSLLLVHKTNSTTFKICCAAHTSKECIDALSWEIWQKGASEPVLLQKYGKAAVMYWSGSS